MSNIVSETKVLETNVLETNVLETKRLQLRQWTSEDLPVFAALNADPEVMEHFPRPLTPLESDAMARKLQNLIADKGWGFWAVSLKATRFEPRSIVNVYTNSQPSSQPDCQSILEKGNDFIGFVGLHETTIQLPCTPCVEIGWRLHKAYWGKGYATEAAKEALRFAFIELALDEVVSFTATTNLASQAVMQRIGMTNTGDNFNHPAIEPNHRLSEHVLYKITKEKWQDLNKAQL